MLCQSLALLPGITRCLFRAHCQRGIALVGSIDGWTTSGTRFFGDYSTEQMIQDILDSGAAGSPEPAKGAGGSQSEQHRARHHHAGHPSMHGHAQLSWHGSGFGVAAAAAMRQSKASQPVIAILPSMDQPQIGKLKSKGKRKREPSKPVAKSTVTGDAGLGRRKKGRRADAKAVASGYTSPPTAAATAAATATAAPTAAAAATATAAAGTPTTVGNGSPQLKPLILTPPQSADKLDPQTRADVDAYVAR